MKNLARKPFFTLEDALEEGISKRMVSYYTDKGEFIRISRGLYRVRELEDSIDQAWAGLAVASHQVKGGVICLVSALIYYDLTDELMSEYWVAIPHTHKKKEIESTRFIRMRNIELGVEEISLCNTQVRIFDIERTIIDSFRLLDIETAMKALKLYMQGHCGKPKPSKMKKYMKELRFDIEKYMLPFLV